MAESSGPSKEKLQRQLRQHLASLRAAGVEWLPKASAKIEDRESRIGQEQASSRSSLLDPPSSIVDSRSSLLDPPSSIPSLTLEQRRQELQLLTEKVCQCTRCPELVATRTQTVFGVGPAGVEVCFVGEAPGADEDAQGEPFVGAAGQLLNRIIAACKMKREEVYICNIIKCRPPGNRTPLPHEAANCREFLERQLELVRPKFICALGATAAKYLLNTNQSIGQLRRRFHDYRGIPVICTYHPAYLLPHRSPDKKKDVWEDMKMLLAKMGRPVE
jgi:DNA polymerase